MPSAVLWQVRQFRKQYICALFYPYGAYAPDCISAVQWIFDGMREIYKTVVNGLALMTWSICLRVMACGLSVLSITPRAIAGNVEDVADGTVVHLKVFELPDASRREAPIQADCAVVREFQRVYPQIIKDRYKAKYSSNKARYGSHDWGRVRLELHQYSGIKIGNLGGHLGMGNLMAIAGRVAPDVMYVNFRQSGTYISKGFLYPLDDPADGYFGSLSSEEKKFRINEKLYPVIKRAGAEGLERIWTMPYGGALGKVIIYRKDIFDQAGVPYPTADWNWDDLIRICRKLSDPANGVYGILINRSRHEAAYWLSFLWSAGGEVLEKTADGHVKAIYDTPEAAKALDFYTRLCAEPWTDKNGRQRYGYAYRDPATAVGKWERGEIAMMFEYIDEKMFASINPDLTGMVPVSKGPTGKRAGELNSRMMGVFAGIEDPVVRDAAWEYIKFYDSIDAARIRTKILVEGGYGRFLNPLYLKMFGYDDVIKLSPEGWSDCFSIAVSSGRPEPYEENCSAIYEVMSRPLEDARERMIAGSLPDDEVARQGIMKGMLSLSTGKANAETFGNLPERDRMIRRWTALAALITMCLVFWLMLLRVVRSFTPPTVAGMQTGWHFRKYAWAYFLLVPAAGTVFLWQYLPLLKGLLIAFQDYNVMGSSKWVWLDNFGDVLWSMEWWLSLWNSLRYSFLVIALTFLPPIVLAIFLQEIPAGRMFFRSVYYLPAVISGLVTILLWKSFYDPDESGALNAILMQIPAAVFLIVGILLLVVSYMFARRLFQHHAKLWGMIVLAAGVLAAGTVIKVALPIISDSGQPLLQSLFSTLNKPYRWLESPDTAMLGCVLPMVWAGIGPGCLIYLAALLSIPDDMYEVADIDGATFIDKILFVVFPMLKALIIINFIGVFIGSWNAAANILAMTGGVAGTDVAGLHIFFEAFVYLRFGPATAMAWVLGFILIGFTVNQLKMLSKMEFKTSDKM